MGTEIERKFLVRREAWRPQGPGALYVQGYLSSDKARVVRVRLTDAGGLLTIKGPTAGLTRAEFEYPIPADDARVLLDTLCEWPLIEKHRHVEVHGGLRWEIDVFHGDNEGLVLAELELAAEDQPFERPPWLGQEVSADHRYANAGLVARPWSTWGR